MGFEQEAFDRLVQTTWGKRSQMQREMSRGVKGEPFVVQELYIKGAMTPSQIAQAMRATTGRVSTLLAGLEKTETRFKAFRKETRSIVTLKGFSCGITLL